MGPLPEGAQSQRHQPHENNPSAGSLQPVALATSSRLERDAQTVSQLECKGRLGQAGEINYDKIPVCSYDPRQGATNQRAAKSEDGRDLIEEDTRGLKHAECVFDTSSATANAAESTSFEGPSYYFTPSGKLTAIRTRTGQPLPTSYPERECQLHSSPSSWLTSHLRPVLSVPERSIPKQSIPPIRKQPTDLLGLPGSQSQPPVPEEQPVSLERLQEQLVLTPRRHIQYAGDRQFFHTSQESDERYAAPRKGWQRPRESAQPIHARQPLRTS
ncbi:hypothetical protein PCANC_18499 [Puccinia coronata f. sp. avenae]|uniref:Uncharacterized protein n=1 Tax=Puccinia coronata f. sp. avenae TaxID=200324 RepID=A0A2N5T1G5_9BASI|nr:hypothetical protein PCANC_18499 [Puccinia coronata f. sp. avenae]